MKYLKKVRLNQINSTKEIVQLKMKNQSFIKDANYKLYEEYFHPEINTNYKFSKYNEISELRNKFIDNEKIKFISEEYKNFLFENKNIIDNFRNSKNLNILSSQFELWENFLNSEYQNFIQNYKRKDEFENIMNKISKKFYKIKPSNSNQIIAEDLLKLHYDIFNDSVNKDLLFTVPINRYNLALMIHPYWGYLCKLQKNLSLEEILNFYKYEIIASQYRENNKIIFSNRISAFNLWKLIDINKKGFISFTQFNILLSACAFEVYNTKDEFLKDNQTICEIIKDDEKEHDFISFRLFEYIFLERCAL
jgi:hypothetical protein